ncbi:MAG: hypothetical protein PHS41_05340, partial [Victivallaceae bacterium]|nr:hypothetical protein [Victivallaceae bacterium]
LDKQKKAENNLAANMLKAGSSEVLLEQIGRIVETIVGPLAFELKDTFRNGITHDCGTDDMISAVGFRIARAAKYIGTQLIPLLADFARDLAQMLLTFLEGLLAKVSKLFSSILSVITQGFQLIVESVKILAAKNMSSAAKGNAILSLLVSFASGVVGNFLIDAALEYLGIPDPFSDILAAIGSAIVGAGVMYLFNKLDLFGLEAELRAQRIKEIFDLRREELRNNMAAFDVASAERLKAHRRRFEELRLALEKQRDKDDPEAVNEVLDRCADFFHVEIPYSDNASFLRYIRTNNVIRIGSEAQEPA